MTLRGRQRMAELFFFHSLLLTTKGEPRLFGQSEPVVGLVGQHCVLPCRLQPAENVAERLVEWTRADLNPSYVHIYRQRRSESRELHPTFKQRTQLSEQGPESGDMSLKLSDLKRSDAGTYTCKLVMDVSSQFSLEVPVVIGAVSEPQITLERSLDKLVFKCEARNWYPKPEMEWRDSKGQIIPHEDNDPVQDKDKYYSILSEIIVEIGASDNYTCTVRQPDIRETRTTNFTVPEVYQKLVSLEFSRYNLVGWLVVMVLLFLSALVMGIVMLIWAGRNLVRRTDADPSDPEEDEEQEDETDGADMPLVERLESENKSLRERVELLQQENDDFRDVVERLQRLNQDVRRVDSFSEVSPDAEAPTLNSTSD